jgi:hypothetical protein
VGLRKICVAANIPMPSRGDWSRLKAGKKITKAPLPPRGPGMIGTVTIGREHYYYDREARESELLGPIPEPPEFSEAIEVLRARVSKEIGRVAVPRDLSNPHPAIGKLLAEEEERAAELLRRPLSRWHNEPRFDSPLERGRLKLMNGLFWAVARADGRGMTRGAGTG